MAGFSKVTAKFSRQKEMALFGLPMLALLFIAVPVLTPLDGLLPLLVLGGLLFWGTLEYPIHKFVLHAPKPRSERLQKLHRRLHYGHHQDPTIPGLIFIPLFVTIPSAVFVFGMAWLIGGDFGRALQFFLGFWIGLAIYEWMHFAVHFPFTSKNRFWRSMSTLHLRHHFKNEKYWFGVTHPVWDTVFGTNPKGSEVEKSKTARNLGYAESPEAAPQLKV